MDSWKKSTRCNSGACVEVWSGEYVVAVRDSRGGEGPLLVFWATDWRAFLAGLDAIGSAR